MFGFPESFFAFYTRANFITEAGVQCEPVKGQDDCSMSQVAPKRPYQRVREWNQPSVQEKGGDGRKKG